MSYGYGVNEIRPNNLTVSIYNDTTEDVPFRISETPTRPIIQNPADYYLSVTRVEIPTSNVEIFRMKDNTQYAFTMLTFNSSNVLGPSRCFLPDYRDNHPNISFGKDIRYYSPEGLCEVISRTMYRSFQLSTQDYNLLNSSGWQTVNETASYGLIEKTYTLPLGPTGRIADIEVEFDYFHVTGLADDEYNSQIPYNLPFSIKLESPSGTVCYLFADNKPFDWGEDGPKLVFSEGSYQACTQIHYDANETRPWYKVLPCETFLKFANDAYEHGDWKISFVFNQDAVINIDTRFKINIYLAPDGYPYLPPSLSIDDSSKKLKLTYDNSYVKNGIKFGFSPKLHEMCNMGNRQTRLLQWPPVNGQNFDFFEFLYPNYSFATNPHVFTQNVSTRYLLQNLSRFKLESASLPLSGENILGMISDDVLCDFSVDSSDRNELGVLTFTTDASIRPWRCYAFDTVNPIFRYDLSVSAVYKHGEVELVQIAPGQGGNIRLSLFPKT